VRHAILLSAAITASILADRPASAASHSKATPAMACSISAIFGQPAFENRSTVFRATITVSCPMGVAFSAALRSAHACRLAGIGGAAFPYEIYRDAAMRSAIVSCDGPVEPLTGTGRQTFIAYGRVSGTVAAGDFADALLATITL
jgi:spore coat protein U-like protein